MSVGAGGEDVDWKWVEETDQVEVVEARISLRHVPCALISTCDFMDLGSVGCTRAMPIR
jgi:hypothetical protein